MNNMIGQVLIVGDKVCDSRFKIFEIRITPQTVVDSRAAYTDKGIVRLDGVIRCTNIPSEELREAYAAASKERRVSPLAKELFDRRRQFQERLEKEKDGYECDRTSARTFPVSN